MKISQNLPQFERFPALFITSGEYEAQFYIAFQGNLDSKEILKMPPREEAREKQGFTRSKSSEGNLSTFSNKGRYVEDLKLKFSHKIHEIIHSILAEYKDMEEIYIFAPKYVVNRILNGLDKSELKKVRMQFYKEYTKNNPVTLIQIFQKEIEKIQKDITQNPKSQVLFSKT